MLNDIKIKYNNTFNVSHSREYYKGKSFHFAGTWKQGCHYFNDEYCCDFVVYNSALLACSKSHLATRETEPINFIYDEYGVCVGVKSKYWDFVLAGEGGAITKERIIEVLGFTPASTDDLENKVDKVEGWGLSENNFSNTYLQKLEKLNIKYDTTNNWNRAVGFIPEEGEIIIYSDYRIKDVDGDTIIIPGIKIGSGNAYVQDLAFVGDDIRDDLLAHIHDQVRHITAEERARWNNKLNVTDSQEVVGETLVFNRN